jgi:hypothetical protein
MMMIVVVVMAIGRKAFQEMKANLLLYFFEEFSIFEEC